MAFDILGYGVAGIVIFIIVAKIYKKHTGNDIAELWKNGKEKIKQIESPTYQRVYITKGIKT